MTPVLCHVEVIGEEGPVTKTARPLRSWKAAGQLELLAEERIHKATGECLAPGGGGGESALAETTAESDD